MKVFLLTACNIVTTSGTGFRYTTASCIS